jgi:hypothetical protein
VSFKRWAGSDPAEDDVVVRRDHTADLHLVVGAMNRIVDDHAF